MDELEFVDGMIVKAPNPKAPDFVKASVSFKVSELAKWLDGKKGQEWVNIDIKSARSGKWYAAVSNFKPKGSEKSAQKEDDSDVPF